MRLALALVACLAAPVALAAPPALELPIACAYGETCFVQNYVDHDPGPGRLDYACGRLSYDGHDGTDFRLRDHLAMRAGVAVLAAAPGTVKAVRDGMADVSVEDVGAAAVRGREAGNGVVVDHGDGWETQYSHLRRGSVAVEPGQRVEAGTPLGLVGLSGYTEFPHVEFAVRVDGRAVDPFVGTADTWACGAPRTALWSPSAAATLAYLRTGVLVTGFADAAPEAEAARQGAFRLGARAGDPPALVFWADVFGAEAGDVQRVRITAPDGSVLIDLEEVLAESNVGWFAFAGKRRPEGGWRAGTYRGRYELRRQGEPVALGEGEIELGS